MIPRELAPRLRKAAEAWPAITLTGPRHAGKTTLCRHVFPDHAWVALDAPDIRAFATEDPRGFLAQFPGGAILDEIQRAPDLPSYLMGMIDEDRRPGRWILTASQDLRVLPSVPQSLAGRTAVFHLLPLTRGEITSSPRPPESLEAALLAGSYPAIFSDGVDPAEWFASLVGAYLERDMRMIRNVADLATFQRFLGLCAASAGRLVNYSALANECGISQPTAKSWLEILEASYLVFWLPVLLSGARRRLVRRPKLHFHDTGLVCWLLGIRTPEQLRFHPLRGSIFATWVASEIRKARANGGEDPGLAFYRDRNGAEVDLVVEHPPPMTLMDTISAATMAPEPFARIRRVRRILAPSAGAMPGVVVYGGEEPLVSGPDRLIPWSALHEYDWETGQPGRVPRQEPAPSIVGVAPDAGPAGA